MLLVECIILNNLLNYSGEFSPAPTRLTPKRLGLVFFYYPSYFGALRWCLSPNISLQFSAHLFNENRLKTSVAQTLDGKRLYCLQKIGVRIRPWEHVLSSWTERQLRMLRTRSGAVWFDEQREACSSKDRVESTSYYVKIIFLLSAACILFQRLIRLQTHKMTTI